MGRKKTGRYKCPVCQKVVGLVAKPNNPGKGLRQKMALHLTEHTTSFSLDITRDQYWELSGWSRCFCGRSFSRFADLVAHLVRGGADAHWYECQLDAMSGVGD